MPLYKALVDALVDDPGVHRAYGGVALPNPQSVKLHEQLGFKEVEEPKEKEDKPEPVVCIAGDGTFHAMTR